MGKSITKIINLLYILSCLLLSNCSNNDNTGILCSVLTNNETTFFPILAWYGPPTGHITDDAFKDLADCNFTMNLSFYETPEHNKRALELGNKYNIKIIVHDNRIDPYNPNIDEIYKSLDNVIEDYSRYPALFGYNIIDEPGFQLFDRAGIIVKYLETYNFQHYGYINLWPIYASKEQLGNSSYEEHVRKYMETVTPRILSFDHYPILYSSIRPEFYLNLEIIREAALYNNVPFWAFARSLPYGNYPFPTEGHLRFQVYSNLAYGAKGIQYYLYWPIIKGSWNYDHAIVTEHGDKSPVYYFVKKINTEILTLSKILLNLESLGIYHSEPIPDGCKKIPEDFLFQVRSLQPLCIGHFKDEFEQEYYFIVNRNYNFQVDVNLQFTTKIKEIVEIAKSEDYISTVYIDTMKNNNLKMKILPGDGHLLQIER